MRKTLLTITLLQFAVSISYAADSFEKYMPLQPQVQPAPTQAPAMQQVPAPAQPQQTQSAPAKSDFKKFDINGKKESKKPLGATIPKKKKKVKKAKKDDSEKTVKDTPKPQTAASPILGTPDYVGPFSTEPPKYIDIQAILAKGRAIQVEEKKESSHANQVEASTQKPDEAIKDMAKTIYSYFPGSLYSMWCKKGFITDVLLQPGESITGVNGGDTVRWLVEKSTSGGNGTPETEHVFVRPLQDGLQTNIVITTDKHVYQVKATSTENTYNPFISWTYPAEERMSMLAIQDKKTKEKAEVTSDEPIQAEAMFFNYTIKSNKGMWASEYSWIPLRAFNDGMKTYLQVNPQMKSSEAPAIFVKDSDGKLNLVNYRLKNNYFIIDRLFNTAELRNGTDEVVIITKENK